MTAAGILDALVAISDDKIWAKELALLSGGRRIDFWTLEPAASRGFRAQAYEIKVSRGDFRRDSQAKQQGALDYADRFWFVTPPGLLKADEIPDWAGLQEWDGKAFHVRRKAPMRAKKDPDWEFVVSLMRNCGDQRRDVGLLKAQVAYFQATAEENKRRNGMVQQFQLQRWVNRATAQKAAEARRSAAEGAEAPALDQPSEPAPAVKSVRRKARSA
jgi:hypothetical protein